jgi:Tfp pilus assembly protein PilO
VTNGADEEEVASLLNEVEGQARKAGLSLLNIKPKPATTTEAGKQYPVEVEVETQMKDLVNFIYGLQSSKYILQVQKLRMVPKGKRKAEVKGYLLINRTVIR